jgi:hypothetical protein
MSVHLEPDQSQVAVLADSGQLNAFAATFTRE